MTGLLTARPVLTAVTLALLLTGAGIIRAIRKAPILRPFCAWCDGDPLADCECIGDCRRRCCPLGAGLETAHRALLEEDRDG